MLKYSATDQQVFKEEALSLPSQKGNIVWSNFSPSKKERFDTFTQSLDLHPLAKEGLLEFSEIPKIDVFKNEASSPLSA